MKKLIIVTGGSGKAGRATIRELLDHGYSVVNVDINHPKEELCRFRKADLNDLGQAYEVLENAYGVIHLAAIPAPSLTTDEYIFRYNTTSTYNIFCAARGLKLKRVVWASSETIIGIPFVREKPEYFPMDEIHPPFPETGYALSKLICEEAARQFNRWTGIPFIGLRFSNIKEHEEYKQFPTFWDDARKRKWNLWGYVDARDVGQSCRLALETKIKGAEVFFIAAADTVMNQSSASLMKEVYPKARIKKKLKEFETVISIDKAKKILGYSPKHSWRDHLT